jgi:carboxylesterase
VPLVPTADPFHADPFHADPSSGTAIRARVARRELTERVLENSDHVATLDNDAPTIVVESAHFVRRVTGP